MLSQSLRDFLRTAPATPGQTESEFHQHWLARVEIRDDPFAQAWQGGLLAARFGFIFSAGYQAATRHIFPTVSQTGWTAFAVSEDRQPDNPLPGVTYDKGADGYTLQGYKTWVAASEHCDCLIVSARGADGTLYFALPVDTPGLKIDTRPPGRMLPDLSQGTAQLRDLFSVGAVDAGRVKAFGPAEVFFIYTAFLASTWRFFPERRAAVETLLDLAVELNSRPLPAWDEGQLELDAGVQQLLASMRTAEGEADELWRRDYKLIAMYTRQS